MSDFHNVFHILVLCKVVPKPELVISKRPKDLDRDLSIPAIPVKNMDCKQVHEKDGKAWRVQVCWERDGIKEVTWESEGRMKEDHPALLQA